MWLNYTEKKQSIGITTVFEEATEGNKIVYRALITYGWLSGSEVPISAIFVNQKLSSRRWHHGTSYS